MARSLLLLFTLPLRHVPACELLMAYDYPQVPIHAGYVRRLMRLLAITCTGAGRASAYVL